MKDTPLSHNWSFQLAGEDPPYPTNFVPQIGSQPATIPGAVHLDLLAAGFIPDPFRQCYERDVAWVDEQPWIYRTEFQWTPSQELPRQVLSFDGLDTVCKIKLNGGDLAESDSMFVPLEANVTGKLRPGANQLEIYFEPAVKVGRERREAYFAKEGIPDQTPNFEDRAFIRKGQYMYGWDWGPRLISCGIWKPVRLLEYRERIRSASFMQERLQDGRYHVWIEADIEGESKPSAEIAGMKRAAGETLEFTLEPDLWWPNGEGPQLLQRASISLGDQDHIEKHIGLRTILLHQDEDAHGRSFEFEVNGRRVWARGANWIPNDSFLARDHEVGKQVEICQKLGMNMLRVWGGGFYESEEFYDACDSKGIMVWQDFPYACSYYPDDPEHQTIASKEATQHVIRLRDRTSLAIWSGNNENLAMFEQGWGGMDQRPQRYYGGNIYDETLPAVLKKLDPSRPYIASSPLNPTQDNIGDSHYWDVWHGRGDWKFYQESKSRFTSEFGFASSCSMECWKRSVATGSELPSNTAVRWHDKTGKTERIFSGFVDLHYPESKTLEDWVYYSQLNQRDAFRCGIEYFRRNPACRGALIWQFNDCWPVQSWAVQDYLRLLKPAGFELKRLYEPVLISIEQQPGKALIHLVNDSPEPLRADLTVELISVSDGSLINREHTALSMGPNERRVVAETSLSGHDLKDTALKAFVVGHEQDANWQLLAEPKEMKMGEFSAKAAVRGSQLAVSVEGFASNLVVWDDEDAFNVFDPRTDQPGWQARTLCNEESTYGLRHAPGKVMMRSLLGPAKSIL